MLTWRDPLIERALNVYRPALAIALPALSLGLFLSQTTVAQRIAFMAALSGRSNATTQPVTVSISDGGSPLVAASQSVGPDALAIDPDVQGQFQTTMLIAGRQIAATVDTGATLVTLNYEDAASIGIHPSRSDFRYQTRTANGTGRVAVMVLPSVHVGNIEARNVQAMIAEPGALTGHNLLGMSFLKKLSSFGVESGRLILRQ